MVVSIVCKKEKYLLLSKYSIGYNILRNSLKCAVRIAGLLIYIKMIVVSGMLKCCVFVNNLLE